MDDTFWNFKFGVEVSAMYHDWRRGTLTTAVRLARFATLTGAALTFLTAFNPLDWAPEAVKWTVAALAIAVACINLWELVFQPSELALKHTELYRRFMKLLEQMARDRDAWEKNLPAWEGESAIIRSDEPPVMWAVYAECWNQVIDRYRLEKKGYYRQVQTWQHLLRNVWEFKPRDFPAGT
jgi:hypothetical protein